MANVKQTASQATENKDAETKAEEEAKPVKKLYRLSRPFFNGKKREPIGTEVYFEEGKQPATAKLVEARKEPEKDSEDEE